MAQIEVAEVWFRFQEKWVLRDISCAVGQGEFVGIIGSNGSGKTTLLRLLSGVLKPIKGNIRIGDCDIALLGREQIARFVAVVPQEFSPVFPFTVEEVVLMGRMPYLRPLSFEGKRDFEIAGEAMAQTDTLHLRKKYINEISSGEKQRVLLAKALTQQPEIILLDEGTAFLDIKHQIEIMELLKTLNESRKLTVIMVTHDLNLTSLFCDRIIAIHEGRIYRMGTPGEVFQPYELKDVYGIDVAVDTDPLNGRPRISLLRGGKCKEYKSDTDRY